MSGEEKRANIIAQQALREAAAAANGSPTPGKHKARRNWAASPAKNFRPSALRPKRPAAEPE